MRCCNATACACAPLSDDCCVWLPGEKEDVINGDGFGPNKELPSDDCESGGIEVDAPKGFWAWEVDEKSPDAPPLVLADD